MLNTKKWKEFDLDKLFDIRAGIYYYHYEYEEGDTPYVSATNINNGIKKRINLKPDFKGNCITTGKIGCTSFFQSEDFCATSDVNIFRSKNFELNRQIGLFIVTIINFSENYKWNYGRQCRIGDSKKIKIKLPTKMIDDEYLIDNKKTFSNQGYVPDFEWIMEYMESIETFEKGNSESIRNSINTKNHKLTSKIIDTSKWRKFRLDYLFTEIYRSKAYIKINMDLTEKSDISINFVTRTEQDNGCDCYVVKEGLDGIEDKNAIIIGDTTATIFYQNEDFVTGDHIVVCRAAWINEHTAMFVKTIIDQERYRYNYGRAFKMESIRNTEISLPVDNEGNPDWGYMENFIKKLPYGDKIYS